LGPAETRHLDSRRRRNLYLSDQTTVELAAKNQLSATVRGLLEASKGTSLGRILEQQVEIDRVDRLIRTTRSDLVCRQEHLIHALGEINITGFDLEEFVARAGYPEFLRDVTTLVDVPLLQRASAIYALLMHVEGLEDREVVAAIIQGVSDQQRQAIREGKIHLRPEVEADIKKLVTLRAREVDSDIEAVVRAADIIKTAEAVLGKHQERLIRLGEKWNSNAVSSLAAIATAYGKHIEQCPDAKEDELEVWAESFTTIFLQATGVRLDPDQLLEVLRQYLEGGPPAGLEALRSYLEAHF
jgi:SpoVK/Ycf46/Vps4 family AAA+-type ATPase